MRHSALAENSFQPEMKFVPNFSFSRNTYISNCSEDYRYHFNGKETDEETGIQDYGMRMYNPLLGRFAKIDPLGREYADISTYSFAANQIITSIDLDGCEPKRKIFYGGPGLVIAETFGILFLTELIAEAVDATLDGGQNLLGVTAGVATGVLTYLYLPQDTKFGFLALFTLGGAYVADVLVSAGTNAMYEAILERRAARIENLPEYRNQETIAMQAENANKILINNNEVLLKENAQMASDIAWAENYMKAYQEVKDVVTNSGGTMINNEEYARAQSILAKKQEMETKIEANSLQVEMNNATISQNTNNAQIANAKLDAAFSKPFQRIKKIKEALK